ncbi:hypothetical protein EJB05_25339 [Eragrostis curvula]|uniref:CASP-like protein n=1 Tax=Eragrostis curvula TaxID=38414 RepID=A0A5J9VC28_9POAL|nr:hypothetical protein EJB05_25339 [Eragrostis curvula]
MPARPRSMAAADLAAHLLSAAAAIDFARHHGRRFPPPASHPPCRSYVHRLMPSPTIHVPSPLWPSALASLVFHGYTTTGCPAIFSHVYPPASLGNNIFPGRGISWSGCAIHIASALQLTDTVQLEEGTGQRVLAYLLISSSSSATARVGDWIDNWGSDPFPNMVNGSIVISFLAFVVFAISALISAYNLFRRDL